MPTKQTRGTSHARCRAHRGQQAAELLDLEQEGPKEGEARVKVKAAGVCMSDWHIMIGDWPAPLPMILGHEAAGEVVEVGAGVKHVKKGDHVIFSFRPNCGHCSYCARGKSVLCIGHNDKPRHLMHDGTSRTKLNGEYVYQMARIGTFAEMVVCPAEQLVSVRKDLPWTHAAIIGCSVATGVGAIIRHAKIDAGSSVMPWSVSVASGSMSCRARGSPAPRRSSPSISSTTSCRWRRSSARRISSTPSARTW